MERDERLTVAVFEPRLDPVIAAALIARAAEGRADLLAFSSEDLPELFSPEVQRKLPPRHTLVLCGQTVVRTDWDGKLTRPELMRRLRAFVGVIHWFSDGPWNPEDRRAVGHLVGEGNLRVTDRAGSLAALVHGDRGKPDEPYERELVDFATGRLSGEAQEDWGVRLRRVLVALKGDRRALARAASDLALGERDALIERESERAEQVEAEIARFARESVSEPLQMGQKKLVWLSLPPEKHPFWAEIGREARQCADAHFSLCRLRDRPVVLLSGPEDPRVDLRDWARYVTDMLPGAETVGARSNVVPLVIERLSTEPALEKEVLRLLEEGAHLLRG